MRRGSDLLFLERGLYSSCLLLRRFNLRGRTDGIGARAISDSEHRVPAGGDEDLRHRRVPPGHALHPPVTPAGLLDFWFSQASARRWFDSTPGFDAEIRAGFEVLWRQAREGRLAEWEATADGALALVILLDQMPLNMFRNQPAGYSTEALSREVAGRAIAQGFDAGLDDAQKVFLYMPYMHSERLADQDRAVELFGQAGLADNARWAAHHRDIVRRFGRFPHRNAILGRTSTSAELEWLASKDAFSP